MLWSITPVKRSYTVQGRVVLRPGGPPGLQVFPDPNISRQGCVLVLTELVKVSSDVPAPVPRVRNQSGNWSAGLRVGIVSKGVA
jgi:hypothetical protein